MPRFATKDLRCWKTRGPSPAARRIFSGPPKVCPGYSELMRGKAACHLISRIRKKSFYWPRYWVKSALRDEMWGTSDARLGCEERHAVQLRELRGAGSKGSSIAADPADCGRSAGGAVAGI